MGFVGRKKKKKKQKKRGKYFPQTENEELIAFLSFFQSSFFTPRTMEVQTKLVEIV